jgi:polar amino acid transport system ATP-binding protein
MDPTLMLLDEPTSALDPELIGEVLTVLKRLVNNGMTMLIVTHELGFASEFGDRLLFMDGGEVIEEGPPKKILTMPKTKRLKMFLEKLDVTSFKKEEKL